VMHHRMSSGVRPTSSDFSLARTCSRMYRSIETMSCHHAYASYPCATGLRSSLTTTADRSLTLRSGAFGHSSRK
jgi:hypothetical protein